MTKAALALGFVLSMTGAAQAQLFECVGQFEYGSIQIGTADGSALNLEVTSYDIPSTRDRIKVSVTSPELSATSLTYRGTTLVADERLSLEMKLDRENPTQSELLIQIGDSEEHLVPLVCPTAPEKKDKEAIRLEAKAGLPIDIPVEKPGQPRMG